MAFQVPLLADFRANFPEMDALYTDAQVNNWLTLATPFFDQCRWDDLLFMGMQYWVAHMLQMSTANAANVGKPFDDAVMKKVGDIAKSRDPKLLQLQMENTYMRTPYGQQYVMYRQLVGIGGFSV